MVRLPLGKLLDKVGQFDDSVNQSMSEMGFSEKIMTTALFPFVLTVPDSTSVEDLDKCKQVILTEMQKKFGYAEIESVDSVL